MTEINAANANAAQTTQALPQAPGANGGATAGLTEERAKALFQEMLNPVAAEISRLRKTAKDEVKPEQEKTVQERLKFAEDKLARGDRRLRESVINEAASAAGVPADRMKAFRTLFDAEFGKRIKVEDDDSVSYYDDLEPNKPIPISNIVADFMKKPEGQMFKPPVSAPNARGLRSSGTAISSSSGPTYAELSPEERGKLTQAQRWSMAQRDMKR